MAQLSDMNRSMKRFRKEGRADGTRRRIPVVIAGLLARSRGLIVKPPPTSVFLSCVLFLFSIRLDPTSRDFNVISSIQTAIGRLARASSVESLRGRAGRFPALPPSIMDASRKKNMDVPAARTRKAASASPSPAAKRLPVKQLRVDDVSASIFAREFMGRNFHSIVFTRSYKDASGTYKYVKSFDVDDLGKIVTVAQQAAEWIHGLNSAEPRSED